ncbi:DAHL domain-containing protein [Pseudomonas sp. Z1-14]|uniref:DAHL domain-containing protein n=1 Tax=Pseudomonas sp. Z1-14 TaxID=2817409 RepID=UPI003DA8C3F1
MYPGQSSSKKHPVSLIKKYKWPALLATALVVFSALIFFLIKSYTGDTATFFESRDFIRQLKQADANWNVKILRKKIGVSNNLSLAPPADAHSRWEQLEQLNSSGPLAALWASRRNGYMDAVRNKTLLVEQFEQHNANLRASLDALPTVEDEIQTLLQQMKDDGEIARLTAASSVLDLALTTLEYALYVTSDKASELQEQLSELEHRIDQLPSSYRPAFTSLTRHVKTVIQEQPVVNDLLDRISVIPVAQELDSINELLNETQRRTAATDRKYHMYLAVCASLMALLMIYLAVRLVRSSSLINQINHELQTSNDKLEQRVEERTRELKEAERELVDSARMAGMAEIATNVLHNVGNVLNSVNISAELVTRKLKNSKTQGLGKAVRMMNEHATDLGQFITEDEKGKLLPRYFNELVDSIATEQGLLIEELAQLTKSIDHIKEIVTTQQTYAGAARLIEPLNVADLFEDALRMNSGALSRHQVTVIKDYQDIPMIMGDKHRLLLILINLISNAKAAMSNVEPPREMTLGVRIVDQTTLCVSVRDRGEGIAPENQARIFNHGFTTRKDGHGFGLHSCALAAVEMNGRLQVQSDGPGQGALFTLEIPLELAFS